ncbi:unnamed protein product [Symbiodinium microadriaticum]|nr:unnamed protein product [Symbiodinium microadriaticum]
MSAAACQKDCPWARGRSALSTTTRPSCSRRILCLSRCYRFPSWAESRRMPPPWAATLHWCCTEGPWAHCCVRPRDRGVSSGQKGSQRRQRLHPGSLTASGLLAFHPRFPGCLVVARLALLCGFTAWLYLPRPPSSSFRSDALRRLRFKAKLRTSGSKWGWSVRRSVTRCHQSASSRRTRSFRVLPWTRPVKSDPFMVDASSVSSCACLQTALSSSSSL